MGMTGNDGTRNEERSDEESRIVADVAVIGAGTHSGTLHLLYMVSEEMC